MARYDWLKDTASFQKAVSSGKQRQIAAAENWLKNVVANREKFSKYDDRWIDHRERELFQAYCKLERWWEAKRICELSIKPESREGRIVRLEELSGKKYDEL